MVDIFSNAFARKAERFLHMVSLVKSVQAVGDYSEGLCEGQYDNETEEFICKNGVSIATGIFTVGVISLAKYSMFGFMFLPKYITNNVVKYAIGTLAMSVAVKTVQYIGDIAEDVCTKLTEEEDGKATRACDTGLGIVMGMGAATVLGLIGYKVIGLEEPVL